MRLLFHLHFTEAKVPKRKVKWLHLTVKKRSLCTSLLEETTLLKTHFYLQKHLVLKRRQAQSIALTFCKMTFFQ